MEGRPDCPHRPYQSCRLGQNITKMLRIQSQLADRYRLANPNELDAMIAAAKNKLGSRLFILGHHYQREEVIKWADARGDSFKLAQLASMRPEAEYIVFCGVHFMAEAADILTSSSQKVILPDLNAGCSMADMADISEVSTAWEELEKVIDISRLIPVTYMNSSADLKAFVAEKGGAVCTSSNARAVIEWALSRGDQVFFFPDQHLGRNTAHAMSYKASDTGLWNPRQYLGGMSETECKEITFFLWKGHCSIHQRFTPEHISSFKSQYPNGVVVVHPECPIQTAQLADKVGSTEEIIKFTANAPSGSTIGIGTEIHLVKRLAAEMPDKKIVTLDPLICPCSTMFRITAAHLAWVLESLAKEKTVNQIQVEPETAELARLALDRMLAIT